MRFGLIGFPIGHSKSPELFREFCGGRYPYDLIEESDFEEAWRRFIEGSYRAVNVTAPFKTLALEKVLSLGGSADPETLEIGACNIVRKDPDGFLRAFNSDYSGVKSILEGLPSVKSVVILGQGGAGRAALCAARHLGLETLVLRHWELADCGPIEADMIISTLNNAVRLRLYEFRARFLLEANYLAPGLSGWQYGKYIPGEVWLRAQAKEGFKKMV